MTLAEAARAIGAGVVYTRDRGRGRAQPGVITSVNDAFVFVRYGAERWSKATRPDDLEFQFPADQRPPPRCKCGFRTTCVCPPADRKLRHHGE